MKRRSQENAEKLNVLAGIPQEETNVVPGHGPTVAEALSVHSGASKVAFTGSKELTDYFLNTFGEDRAETLLRLLLDEQVKTFDDFKKLKEAELKALGFKMGDLMKLEGVWHKDPATNRERVKNLINDIAQKYEKNKNKKVKQTSDSQKETKAKTSRKRKETKAHVGWLNFDGKKYTQVRLQDGGGNREISVGDDISASDFKQQCIKIFWPQEGSSPKGSIQDYDVELGNFQRNVIKAFTNLENKPCGIKDYLNCRGLYLSKTYFYIMTKGHKISGTDVESRTDAKSAIQCESDQSAIASSSTTADKTKSESDQKQSLYIPLFEGRPYNISCNDRQIKIKYTKLVNSSYSLEIICTSSSYSRNACLENISTIHPEVMDMEIENFTPLDYDYQVTSINLCDVNYFSQSIESSKSDTDEEKQCLIKVGPDTLWGYDDGELVIAAVSEFETANYQWYKDGREMHMFSGINKKCIAIHDKGTYTVVVTYKDKIEVSKPLHVTMVNAAPRTEDSIPVIESEELKLSRDDENLLGEGGFGKVYKGKWNGTDVAIKEIKTHLRNRMHQEQVIKNEVGIHSRIRHPGIVQIMCIAYTQRSVLLVSEYVDGCDLETAIFDKKECIGGNEVCQYAKQICQAVAYLHGRNPQIIHQDIKPANVLINPKTVTAKLCDLGLSKLKLVGAATTTCASSVAGTLMYMAPEGLLQRKTYVQSDIWALGCTILELITKEEVWDIANEADPSEFLTKEMKLFKLPTATKHIPSIYAPMKKCFDYDRLKRPSALELIELF